MLKKRKKRQTHRLSRETPGSDLAIIALKYQKYFYTNNMNGEYNFNDSNKTTTRYRTLSPSSPEGPGGP